MGWEGVVDLVLPGRAAGRIVDNQVYMRLERLRAPNGRAAGSDHAEEEGAGRLVVDAARVAHQLTAGEGRVRLVEEVVEVFLPGRQQGALLYNAVDVVLGDDEVDQLKLDLRIAGDRGVMPDAQALIRRVDQNPGDFGVIHGAQPVEVVQHRRGILLDGEAIGPRRGTRRCCGRVHILFAVVVGSSIDRL